MSKKQHILSEQTSSVQEYKFQVYKWSWDRDSLSKQHEYLFILHALHHFLLNKGRNKTSQTTAWGFFTLGCLLVLEIQIQLRANSRQENLMMNKQRNSVRWRLNKHERTLQCKSCTLQDSDAYEDHRPEQTRQVWQGTLRQWCLSELSLH